MQIVLDSPDPGAQSVLLGKGRRSVQRLREDGEVPCLACSGWRSRTGGKVWGLYVVIPSIVIEAKESPEKNMWEDSDELNHPFLGQMLRKQIIFFFVSTSVCCSAPILSLWVVVFV